MNNKRKFMLTSLIVILGVAVGFIASVGNRPVASMQHPSPEAVSVVIEQHSSYVLITREEMIQQADLIFVGKVKVISPTSWNQDNGEYWNNGLLIHTLEVEILRPIAGDTQWVTNKSMLLTILGNSPADGHSEHGLQTDNQAVFFVRETDLAWREGKRKVVMPLGMPTDFYFLLGTDGTYHGRFNEQATSLEKLIERISQHRDVLMEP